MRSCLRKSRLSRQSQLQRLLVGIGTIHWPRKPSPLQIDPKVNHRRRPQRDSRARGCTAYQAYRKRLVPELTRSAGIQLNARVSLLSLLPALSSAVAHNWPKLPTTVPAVRISIARQGSSDGPHISGGPIDFLSCGEIRMLFELVLAAIVGVFSSWVYSMIDHFMRDLNEQ